MGVVVQVLLAAVSAAILAVTGYAWVQYRSLDAGLHRSGALAGGATPLHGDTNILLMGLDSRLDENGNPMPANIYDALHAGDSSSGEENANVLMLIHVPGNGGRARRSPSRAMTTSTCPAARTGSARARSSMPTVWPSTRPASSSPRGSI